MATVIPHAAHEARFASGVRVLFLKGRKKDGVTDKRTVYRISLDTLEFAQALLDLMILMRPGERIYVSASARDMPKAIRMFKERQLLASHDPNPLTFYERLQDRWVSCLMAPSNAAEKIWMFDCDTPEEYEAIEKELHDLCITRYVYATKSGHHIVISPINRTWLSALAISRLDRNPMLLWAY